MSLFQAFLIGIFAYLGAKRTPWFFGVTGGWNMLGRPLVAGLIVGIILGDVTTGVIAGAMVQALFIGQITPGGAMPSDVNWASYIGIPLAIAAGGGGAEAVALAVPLSIVGLGLFNFIMSINTFFPHWGDKAAENGDVAGIQKATLACAIPSLILRGGSAMILCYFGAPLAEKMLASTPDLVLHYFTVVAKLLPAVGFALLLKQSVKAAPMILLFIMGWILMSATSMTMTALALFAAGVAYIFVGFKSQQEVKVAAAAPSFEEEDDNYEE